MLNANFIYNKKIQIIIVILFAIFIGILVPLISESNILIISVLLIIITPFLYSRLREGFVLTISLLCMFTPSIYSQGIQAGGINISVTDFIIVFNLLYLAITKRTSRMRYLVRDYPKIFLSFVLLVLVIFIYLGWSVYFNDFAIALKLVRTLMYPLIIYLLVISSYDENNLIKYLIFLSLSSSLITVFTYRSSVFIASGEYALFRNSEAFLASMLCFLIIWVMQNKSSIRNKISIYVAIISLISAIIVQQDRVQIIAVCISVLFTTAFLVFKRKLSLKKVFYLTSVVLLIFFTIYFIVKLVNIEGINNMFHNYYEYRIKILFNNSGDLQLDSSLSYRLLEYKDILNIFFSNGITFLFGKGLAATYLQNIIIVDSFWFWIVLNFGLIGILLFAYIFILPVILIVKSKKVIMAAPLLAYLVATFVMTLTTPNMIYRVDDAVSFGIFFGLLHILLIKHQLPRDVKQSVSINNSLERSGTR